MKDSQLLLEYHTTSMSFWTEIRASFGGFFSVFKNVTKKFANSLSLWMKINFPLTPFKTKTKYEQLFQEYNRSQYKLQREIDSTIDRMNQTGGWGSFLPYAPGLVMGGYAIDVATRIGSGDYRDFLEDTGLIRFPGVRKVFTDDGMWFFSDPERTEAPSLTGTLNSVFEKIQSVFLLTPLTESTSRLNLLEAEEKQLAKNVQEDIAIVLIHGKFFSHQYHWVVYPIDDVKNYYGDG